MIIPEQSIPQLIVNENKKLMKYLQIIKTTQINHEIFNKTSLIQKVNKYVNGDEQTSYNNNKQNHHRCIGGKGRVVKVT